jgi:flavin-binding protein dodecin
MAAHLTSIMRTPSGIVAGINAGILARTKKGANMSHHVYKKLDLVGSSPVSIEDAIATAIAKSHESVKHMRWFEVGEIRGEIADGKPAHFQVTIKVGFTLEA